jgi:hypothetical protein
MSRHRPAHVAQGTWRSGALHVWGWNGIDTAPMAWLYGGFRAPRGRRHPHRLARHAGVVRRDRADQPRPRRSTVAARVVGAARRDGHRRLAVGAAGRAVPVRLARLVRPDRRTRPPHGVGRADHTRHRRRGPVHVARWKPVTTESIDATLAALAASMPPICTAGSGVEATTIYAQLVDGIARSFLFQYGWKADLGRQRTARGPGAAGHLRGARETRPRHARRHRRLRRRPRQLRDELDRHRRRLAGEPVVVPGSGC